MNTDALTNLGPTLAVWLTQFGLKAAGAIALWIIGRRLIHFSVSLMQSGLRRQPIDSTVIGFIGSAVSITLNVVLVVALLGFFGVETTSFAALLAGAGLAIGTAWSGLLANFAAGVFLMVLRPFKAGDFVTAGGVTGTVDEIGLFSTMFSTPDNIKTFVGNNKIFSDTIQNFSATPYRRVDLKAQIAGSVEPKAAMQLLQERLARIPNVLRDPPPVVEILEFTAYGPVLAVRPFCEHANYWQVYFDTNRTIREAFGEAGFPAPELRYRVAGPG
ncbi:MAG: mechanosensitive ion channel family protein [bacterium]